MKAVQIERLYEKWVRREPYEKLLEILARDAYLIALQWVTYKRRDGTRAFKDGPDPIMKQTVERFKRFVVEYQRGYVSFEAFDQLLWAMHHNGAMADMFIEDVDEEGAMQFLNHLGGIRR